MKKLTAIITIVLILLFLGLLVIQNCECCKSKCSAEEVETEEGAVCADDCQKACCLGCHATEGDAKCIVLEDGSMPCCTKKTEANCCCGDATCDGSCHGDAAEEAHDHGAEGHSHE